MMLVSVIIPTFNRAGTLVQALESALNQTYPEKEVIVVDDGSTDQTHEVLNRYSGRIKVIRQQNAGPSAARNRGADAAKGEIIAFLDSDDHWLPEKIERQADFMSRAGPSLSCCVCDAVLIGLDGEVAGHTFDIAGLDMHFDEGEWSNPQEVLATRFLLFNQVAAIRRDAFERVRGYNENLRLLEDYEISLKLSCVGTWGAIRQPLVIKHNDTNGIGVECMMDRERHVRVQSEVIAGLLASEQGLGPFARANLKRTLGELEFELRVLGRQKPGGLPAVLSGRTLEFLIRLRRAARRRGSSWPKFQGRELPPGKPDIADGVI